MSLGGGSPEVDTSVSDATAALMREQYADYLNRFVPLEDELIKQITEPTDGGLRIGNTALTNRYVDEAQEMANRQMGVSGAVMNRMASRYGMPMTADRRQTMDRGMNLSSALMQADVANKTRDNIEDFNVNMATQLMNTGRGLSGDANSLYGSASSLEAARNQVNQQMAAQQQSNLMQGIGTLGGLGIAAFAAGLI
jgi:hypothetical protein